MRRALPAAAAAAAATGAVAAALWRDGDASPPQQPRPWDDPSARPAPRAAQLAALRSPAGFDVLVIGGAQRRPTPPPPALAPTSPHARLRP